mmetsp:Transcript_39570/g.93186  ORF Transcript_39570/g.93186 Transcript_39570/m.93186 type:complete len:545 (-) Transcript_39570:41-1675(-)
MVKIMHGQRCIAAICAAAAYLGAVSRATAFASDATASRTADSSADEIAQCQDSEDVSVQLLQRGGAVPTRGTFERKQQVQSRTEPSQLPPINAALAHQPLCTSLRNDGPSFSIEMQIGTPEAGHGPQLMYLIADTGSNALVVNSCLCNILSAAGTGCELEQDCFLGTGVSPTFLLSGDNVRLSYGSGSIACKIGSDFAMLTGSNISAFMPESIFLVQDRHELAISGAFLGILGLGIPRNPNDNSSTFERLFMQEAGLPRFSVCFNDAGLPGFLQTGFQPLSNPMTSVGVYHWGLGLNGLRVGSSSAPAFTCTPDMPGAGVQTNCGIIPDSGTTQVLGPPDQVDALFDTLCYEWPRCQQRASEMGTAPSANHFRQLLLACHNWLTPEQGINEIPSIFFDIVGGNGVAKSVELTAWSWIVETAGYEVSYRSEEAASLLQHMDADSDSRPVIIRPTRVCVADIGKTVYPTTMNGPIWILGQALFYQGTVKYDMTSYPPTMELDMESSCSCQADEPPSLMTKGTSSSGKVRQVEGSPRRSQIDTSLPL